MYNHVYIYIDRLLLPIFAIELGSMLIHHLEPVAKMFTLRCGIYALTKLLTSYEKINGEFTKIIDLLAFFYLIVFI